MPEQYVQTRINLLTALREIDRESKNVVSKSHYFRRRQRLHDTEKYGIEKSKWGGTPLFVQEKEVQCLGKRIFTSALFSKETEGNKTFLSYSKDYPSSTKS